MLPPADHPCEAERLALLRQCGILDTEPEPEFDGLVALASAIAGTPIALVSLIDGKRQWFKARHGLDASETPREIAFCAHAILGEQPLVVEDARLDPRFSGNPAVTGQSRVVFYAGVPLTAGPRHLPLGTLCVVDHEPHAMPAEVLARLRILARQVEVLIESRLRRRELEDALVARARAEPQAALLVRVVEQVPGMIFQYLQRADGTGKFLYSSAASRDIYGFSPEQLMVDTKEVSERVHPDDRLRARASFTASASTFTEWNCEYRYRHPDGRSIWLHGRGTPERVDDGSILWHGIITDITERKLAEARIRTLQEQFQDAIESLNAGFVMYDADESLVLCNRKYAEIYHIPGDILRPGIRYEAVIREAVRADPEHFAALIGDQGADAWVAKRMASIRSSRSMSHHQQLGGRWIQVDEVRSRSGGFISLRTDVTEIKLTEATLRQQTELMRLATTTAGIGMWVYEFASGGLRWDERMCEMYAYGPGEFPGVYAGWRDRVHPEDRERTEAELERCIASGANFRATFRLLLPSGEVRHIAASAAVTSDADGRATQMVGVNLDVTEQVTREARIQRALGEQQRSAAEAIEARKQAESAGRAKADFLATMSHEIRTPMNGVIGMTSLLLDTKLSGEQREYIDAIRLSGDALLTVINDILDFSKIEAGKLAIEPIRFDLRTAAEDVLDLLGAKATEKGLDLLLDHPAGVRSRVIGDEGRVRQILLNLVGNALKFTERGAVVVTVEELDGDGDRVRMRLTVSDTGLGMDREQVARLFQPFSQADATTSRRFGGTGLGLAICARLCALMGGTIVAASEPGVGSRFTVEMPFAIAADDGDTSAIARQAPLRDQRALVVSDRQPSGAILVRALASWGMTVATASDAASAAAELARWSAPGLLLLDRRAGMEAVELLAAIRGRCAHAQALPVLLAASGVRGDAERMAAAGFRAYLTRPLRLGTLRQALLAALADQRQLVTRYTVAENAATQAPRDQRASSGRRRMRVLLAEDNSINQKVARRLLERMECLVDIAGNGVEAVDLAVRVPYDLILMDCQMPEMDGFAAARAIRAGAGPCKAVPIIALTANAMQSDREDCLAAGMSDHLAKPITSQTLGASLDLWLGKGEIAAPAAAPVKARCADALAELGQQIGNVTEVVGVVRQFLGEIPRYRAEIDRHVAAADPAGLGKLLHSLRGSASALGLEDFSRVSAAAEAACRSGGIPDLGGFQRSLTDTATDLQAWVSAQP